jgi:hypothetical protein
MKYQVKKALGYGSVMLIRSGLANSVCGIKSISSNVQCHA